MASQDAKDLLALWRTVEGKTTQEEHAESLGMTLKSYTGKIYRAQLDERSAGKVSEDFGGYDQPSLYDWRLPETMKFTWDDFMVVGDVQLPTTDYDFAMLPALVAKRHLNHTPRRLIIAGDFWNMDAFSKYDRIVSLPTWKDEQNAARNLLAIWDTVFDEIYLICGNHERRRLAHMQGEEGIADIVQNVLPSGKIQASVMDACEVMTTRGKVTVLHGGTYRKQALSAADEMAQKYQSHIIAHHEHHCAFGVDRFDRYYVINNGGLFDVKKMAYVNIASTPMSGMSQGFTMVKDGTPYLFHQFSDWGKWI